MSTEHIPTTDSEPSVEYIGSIIHDLRENAGFTISDLSHEAGVSQGLLSQVERGVGNPSYLTLLKIARALHVPVGNFFSVGETTANGQVVRADSRRQLQVTDKGLVYELITPTMSGHLLMIKATIPPGYSNEAVPFNHAQAEECLFILEGHFHAQVGDDAYILGPGDSVTYHADQQHWFRNIGDTDAVVIAAMTPPVF